MSDRLTNELKKKLKVAKDNHKSKMDGLGDEDKEKNSSLNDW